MTESNRIQSSRFKMSRRQFVGSSAAVAGAADWRDQHASWNQGAMDGWLLTHTASDGDTNGSFTMGYYTQQDIPFHWALAQSFTLLDNYHCAVMGPTDPNRLHWEHGGNDPQGKAGGPVLETGGVKDLSYETGYETIFNAGYSFKWYHASGWIGPSDGNYLKQFQTTGLVPAALFNAVQSSSTLFGNGTPGGIGDPLNPTAASNPQLAFEEDCANGVLPDVSFIGTGASEHPPGIPAAGAQFLASKLEALAANEDLWNSTVFIINYDENDGFFGRRTFGDFTGSLRGAAQPAPASTQFDPATTAANLAAQTIASRQPQTPRPGATQQMPKQDRR
ncbi:MAG: alkaline phosphatase family protein [Streptosporangiaceae bacterium]